MSSTVPIGECSLDLARGQLEAPGRPTVRLSPLEAAFLAYLARRPDTTVPKQELLIEVWGYREGVRSRALDASVLRLRTKLEGTGIGLTVYRGRGVQLEVTHVRMPEQPRPLLIGRDSELEELEKRLQVPGLHLLWGPPGVGKTTLSKCLGNAHHLQSVGVPSLRAEVARRLGCSEDTLYTALGSSNHRWVLDEWEARDADELELIRVWAQRACILVVGVPRFDCDTELRLDGLQPDTAELLLDTLVGAPHPAHAGIVARTDGLPRQIELLAEGIRFIGIDAFLGMGHDGSQGGLVEAVRRLWEGLEPEDAEMLAAVSVFQDRFDVLAAAHLADCPPYEALKRLERLWSRALVQGERGVFRLLAPVRSVAEPHQSTHARERLIDWMEVLLQDNVRGGARVQHHYADLCHALLWCEESKMPAIGMFLIEFLTEGQDIAEPLHRAALRGNQPVEAILVLQAAAAAYCHEVDKAKSLMSVVSEPDQNALILLHETVHLALDPNRDSRRLTEREGKVSAALFHLHVTVAGVLGWNIPIQLCERLATTATALSWPASALAMFSWASHTARTQNDPRWIELGYQGTQRQRVTVDVHRGDPEAALKRALDALETTQSLQERQTLAGMACCLLLILGRRNEAEALEAQHPSSGRAGSIYLHLCRAVLGKPASFHKTRLKGWVEAWRKGEALDVEAFSPHRLALWTLETNPFSPG